jgi:hypothetical protein
MHHEEGYGMVNPDLWADLAAALGTPPAESTVRPHASAGSHP